MSAAEEEASPTFWHNVLSLRFEQARAALSGDAPGWAQEAARVNDRWHGSLSHPGDAPADFAGSWQLQRDGEDIVIEGVMLKPCDRVHIIVDGALLVTVPVKARPAGLGTLGAFRFIIAQKVRSAFNRKAYIGVASEAGPLVHAGTGRLVRRVSTSTGSGKLLPMLFKGSYINKKGSLAQRITARPDWQVGILDAYQDVRDYFERTFGYRLYFFYGSLLGLHRDNDFISHDDDFDAGYFSRETSAAAVKAEMVAIMRRMRAEGYDLQVSTSRGFFKPTVNGRDFDIFPAWAEDGRIWSHTSTSVPGDASMFEPVASVRFKDRDVYVPHQREAFLAAKYGPGWAVPDPGYRIQAPPGAKEHLAKSALSEQEAEEFGG